MNQKILKVKITDSLQDFIQLEKPWNELASRCPSRSLYSSYDYNRIAWKHFSKYMDRLFVLAVYDGAMLIAIAPFCITRQKIRSIPVHRIDFIAAWEGDKPSIIAPSCEEAAWEAIYSFLTKEYHSWDVLNIKEQPQDSNLFTQCAFLHDAKFVCQVTHDSTSYYVNLAGTWASYFDARGTGVKKRFRNCQKKLRELPGGLSIEIISQPEQITETLNRFAALEKLSWKGGAGIGIHKDVTSLSFYNEFTKFLSEKGQAAVYFLKIGDKDIASYIIYVYRNVVYHRHSTYDPAFAKFTPGIYLKTYIIQNFCGADFIEFDDMGMHPREGIPRYKVEWASGTCKTSQFLVFKKNIKLLPIILGKEIKTFFRRFITAPG